MKYKQLQSGFTLMEVMFAVMILAIGLVFLACQFPVGLFASRDIAEASQNVIESHNSQVMMDIHLSDIFINGGNAGISKAIDRGDLRTDLSVIHFLAKPNVLADSVYTNTPMLILDDLEGFADYLWTGLGQPPQLPFWSLDNDLDPPGFSPITISTEWPMGLGDIGHIVSPPVDASNPKVQMRLQAAGAGSFYSDPGYPDKLDQATFWASLESRYSWAAMYNEANSSQFYIFTLRHSRKEVRYAMQTPESFEMNMSVPGAPYNDPPDPPLPIYPGHSDWDPLGLGFYNDRVFPVPWRVCLPLDYWYRYNWIDYRFDNGDSTMGNDENIGPAAFIAPKEIADILQPGSIIIDADPQDPHYVDPIATPLEPQTTGAIGEVNSGLMYEVVEILPPTTWETNDPTDTHYYNLSQSLTTDPKYLVRLRTPLRDHLHYFWIFPPPVIRNSNGTFNYDGKQPVVSVTKKLINFK